jgi:NAD(P)-dependent dehydrogenase (short-subunit alcohol dehydrogenase family)
MISAAGGSAVALRVDHTVEEEVEALFQRVERERGRLDVLVNSIAGEDPLMAQWCSFWKTDLKNAEAALRQSLLSHIITSKFVGRAVVALAGDPAILKRSGQLFSSWELGREYRFTDTDRRRPDWGASKIDFSKHPEQLLQLLRIGAEIQLRWLSELRRKTKHFLTKLPQTRTKAVRGTRIR